MAAEKAQEEKDKDRDKDRNRAGRRSSHRLLDDLAARKDRKGGKKSKRADPSDSQDSQGSDGKDSKHRSRKHRHKKKEEKEEELIQFKQQQLVRGGAFSWSRRWEWTGEQIGEGSSSPPRQADRQDPGGHAQDTQARGLTSGREEASNYVCLLAEGPSGSQNGSESREGTYHRGLSRGQHSHGQPGGGTRHWLSASSEWRPKTQGRCFGTWRSGWRSFPRQRSPACRWTSRRR